MELVDRYFGHLVLLARRWSGEHAEDVVQETFLKLVRLDNTRGKPPNVAKWLYTTAKTTAIDAYRKDKRGKAYRDAVLSERSIAFVASDDESVEAREIAARLQSLPEELYECVILRIWLGFSFEEIADATGTAKTTVFRQYQKALEILEHKRR